MSSSLLSHCSIDSPHMPSRTLPKPYIVLKAGLVRYVMWFSTELRSRVSFVAACIIVKSVGMILHSNGWTSLIMYTTSVIIMLLWIHVRTLDRARSPPTSPLKKQDEIADSSDEEHTDDENILEHFADTGAFTAGTRHFKYSIVNLDNNTRICTFNLFVSTAPFIKWWWRK